MKLETLITKCKKAHKKFKEEGRIYKYGDFGGIVEIKKIGKGNFNITVNNFTNNGQRESYSNYKFKFNLYKNKIRFIENI